MRTVALVAAHFPPSNMASVHRARLLAQHLREFGWKPIIVTAHHRYYEEQLDWDLAALVDPSLEIIRTRALPTRPIRLVGDIGLRALPWSLAALRKLRKERRIDFVHITMPPAYSALLGQMLYRKDPLPFGLDYTDPWVHTWPAAEIRFSKAWTSSKLAEFLEPRAVKNASLITGVASGYYEGVFQRHPELRERCAVAAFPIGFSTLDFEAPALRARQPRQFDPRDGNLHLVYAGALLPKAHGVLARLLEGVAHLRRTDTPLAHRLRFHFIGTGKAPNDCDGHNVLPVAERLGVADLVTEHPHRMGYFEVLTHLVNAHGVLIVGSTEPHYTPSKVFQAVQSRRPVLALLHEDSTAIEILERSRAGIALRLSESHLPDAATVAATLTRLASLPYDATAVDWTAFDDYSARSASRGLASAMNEAIEKFNISHARR